MTTVQRYSLLACILSSSLVGMDGMMTPVALPAIAEDLDAGLALQQWMVAAFLLALGGLVLVGGSLGDVFNRWLVFGVGTAGFGAAALLCAAAPTAPVLIGGRLLQGVAAALMVPGALAAITSTFEGAQRSRAIGTWSAWSGLSVIVGPLLAGWFVESLSWRLVYAILVPLAAIVVWLIAKAARNGAPTSSRGRIDLGGAVLGLPVVGGPAVALIQGPTMGWGHPLIIAAIVVSVLAAVVFLWWERRTPHALLPLYLFKIRNFSVLNVVTFVLYGALISSGTYTVLFLQQTAGYAPTLAGLAAAVPVMILLVFSQHVGTIADRHDPRWFVAGGAALAGMGILLLLRTDSHADFLTVVVPSVLIHGIGLTLLVAPLTAGVLGAVSEDYAGVASGVNNAVARIGSMLAIAAVGILISTRFSAAIDAGVEGQESAVVQAVDGARGRPLSVDLPGDLAPGDREIAAKVLTDASIDAFRFGMGVIGTLAVVAGAMAAVGMGRRQRHVPTPRVECGVLHGVTDN